MMTQATDGGRVFTRDEPEVWGDLEQPHISLISKIEEVQAKLDATAKILAELTGASHSSGVGVEKPAPGALNLLDAKVDELSKIAQHLMALAMAVKMRIA